MLTFDLFTARSNLRPHVEKSFSQWIIKINGWNLQRMIKVVKLFSYCQNFMGYLPLPFSYMYVCKLVKSLNVISERAWTVFTRYHIVHIGPSVERILTFCSNGSASFNKMAAMIYMVIHLKIFFSRTKKTLKLNFGIQHQELKVYRFLKWWS